MTEREHQSSFFKHPDSLELIVPPQDDTEDTQDQLPTEGVSVNMVDRWQSILTILEKMPERGRLLGLMHKTGSVDGKKRDWGEWHARQVKNGVLERSPFDYERYLKNSKNKFHRLRDEMLGEVAVFLASDQMVASGYADEDTMKMNAEMALYDLREAVYLAPEKRKKMIANAKSGLIHFSPREEE